jgi:hypothetical protein
MWSNCSFDNVGASVITAIGDLRRFSGAASAVNRRAAPRIIDPSAARSPATVGFLDRLMVVQKSG